MLMTPQQGLGPPPAPKGKSRPPIPPRPDLLTTTVRIRCEATVGQRVHRPQDASAVQRHTVLLVGQPTPAPTLEPRIEQANWYQVEEGGSKPVRFSACRITVPATNTHLSFDSSPPRPQPRTKMAATGALHSLPPLPKSLSGLEPAARMSLPPPPPPPDVPPRLSLPPAPHHLPQPRKPTTLDTQLAVLRREMYGLRELDLTLLSQLWSLNESIQELRALQEALSPPSPAASDADEADCNLYCNLAPLPEHYGTASSDSSPGDLVGSRV